MKRLTVLIEEELYAQLESLATDERRDFKDQVIIILERAVKMHAGQKKAAKRRERRNEFGY